MQKQNQPTAPKPKATQPAAQRPVPQQTLSSKCEMDRLMAMFKTL